MRSLTISSILALLIVFTSHLAFAEPTIQVYDLGNECLTEQNANNLLPGTLVSADKDAYSKAASETLTNAYWFYNHYFDRESFDGQGINLKVTVHAKFGFGSGSCNGNNAMYDNNNIRFLFGDGDGERMFMPGAAPDLVAHEFTHGVTHVESNLTYQDESGAINEALSDIFGVAAQIWQESGGSAAGNPSNGFTINDDSYTMGEKLVPQNGDPTSVIRVLNDPSGLTENYPDTYSEYKTNLYINGQEICQKDYGCVHFNMSLLSLSFNLLAEGGTHPQNETDIVVPAIGLDKALAIYYHAATNTFTSSTNHEAAKQLLANSAATIYGECSVEWHSVNKSLDAIKVPGDWTPCETEIAVCDENHPELCTTAESCSTANLTWCTDKCQTSSTCGSNDDTTTEPSDDFTDPSSTDNEAASDLFEMAQDMSSMSNGMGSMIEPFINSIGTMVENFGQWGESILTAMSSMVNLFGGNSVFGKFFEFGKVLCQSSIEICKDIMQMMVRIGEMIQRMGTMAGRAMEMWGKVFVMMDTISSSSTGMAATMTEFQAWKDDKANSVVFIHDPASLAILAPTSGTELTRNTVPQIQLSNNASHYMLFVAQTAMLDLESSKSFEVTAENDLDTIWPTAIAGAGASVYIAVKTKNSQAGWSSLSNTILLHISGEPEPICSASNPELCEDEENCNEQGLNWCDNQCQEEECPVPECGLLNPELCQDEVSCQDNDLNWCGETCLVDECPAVEECDVDHPELCVDEANCLANDLSWCNKQCQDTECSEPALNLALTSYPRASSWYDYQTRPDNVIDDNSASFWVSRPLFGPYQEEWLTFSFYNVTEVSQVIINWRNNGFARNYAVFTRNNYGWEMVYDGNKSVAGQTVVDFEPKQVREVMIRLKDGFNMRNFQINEIEIY